MCDKAVDTCPFVFDSILDSYKTKKLFDKTFSRIALLLKYYLDLCKTQEMCDKAVDNFSKTLEFLPDWFVRNKMIKKFFGTLYANDNIIF